MSEYDFAEFDEFENTDYPSWGESFFDKPVHHKPEVQKKVFVIERPATLSTRKWEPVSSSIVKQKLTKEEEDAIAVTMEQFHTYEGLYVKPIPIVSHDSNPDNGTYVRQALDTESYLKSFVNDAEKFMQLISRIIPDPKKNLVIINKPVLAASAAANTAKPSKKTTSFSFQQTEEERDDHKKIIKKYIKCQIVEEYEQEYQDKVIQAEEDGVPIPEKEEIHLDDSSEDEKIHRSKDEDVEEEEVITVAKVPKKKKKKWSAVNPELLFKHLSKEDDKSRNMMLKIFDPVAVNGIYCKLFIQYYPEVLKSWIDPGHKVDIPRIASETIYVATPKKINIFNSPLSVLNMCCNSSYGCFGFIKKILQLQKKPIPKDFKDANCNFLHIGNGIYKNGKNYITCPVVGCDASTEDHYLPLGVDTKDTIILHSKHPNNTCDHDTASYCKNIMGDGCQKRHRYVGPQIISMIIRNILATKYAKFEDWPLYNNDVMQNITNKLLEFPIPKSSFKDLAMATTIKMLLNAGAKYDWPHKPFNYFDDFAANVINIEATNVDGIIFTIMKDAIRESYDITVDNLQHLVTVMKKLPNDKLPIDQDFLTRLFKILVSLRKNDKIDTFGYRIKLHGIWPNE